MICFLLGCSFLFMGLGVEPVMPYASLDAVLTQEELRDPETHDKTLEILKKAGGARWFFWTLAGIATTLASGFGYWAASERVGRKPAPTSGLDD